MAGDAHSIPELDRKGLRNFGLTTGAMVVLLFGLLIPWVFSLNYPTWPWILFAVLAVLGLAVPNALRPIYRGWMRFGLIMSRITTPIVLGIVFYLMVLPMGFVMRKIFGKDPMARTLDKNSNTYRVRSADAPPENLERPF